MNYRAEHRQVNIMIDRNLCARLCDFGLAKFVERSTAELGEDEEAGTARWKAPELIMPEDDLPIQKTKATDIYAFGMTIYEVLSLFIEYAPSNLEPCLGVHRSRSVLGLGQRYFCSIRDNGQQAA